MSCKEWKKVQLGDVASLITGFPFKGALYAKEGIPVVRGDNVTIGSLRWNDKKCWNLYFDRFEEFSLQEQDIVVGMDGSRVGKNRAKIKKEDLPLLLAQRVACIRSNNKSNQKFLYYHVFSNRFESYVKSIHTGTSIPHISLNQIRDFELYLPPLEEQQRIAAILGALDDKIELNNKINKNLEEQASALFKHWFVDFEFPDANGKPYKSCGGALKDSELGPIPSDWSIGTLGEMIEVKYGKDHKSLEAGTVPVYGSGGIMRFVDKYLYDKESVLIPRKGTLNNIMYLNSAFWSVDTMFYSIMRRPNIAKYVYLLLRRLNMADMNVGSAVPSMTVDVIQKINCYMADDEVFKSFDLCIDSLFKKIEYGEQENKYLAQLRDALLPKLMNNEVLK